MYLLQSILIGILPIIAFTFIGLLINRRNWADNAPRNIIIAIIVGIIWSGVIWYVRWAMCGQIYGPLPLFGWIMFSCLFGGIIGAIDEDDFKFSAFLPGLFVFILMLFWVIGVTFQSGGFVNSTKLGKVLKVETKKVDEQVMEIAEPAHICQVSEAMALNKTNAVLANIKTADNATASSRYDIGQPTKQMVDGCLWWIFSIDFSKFWQWNDFPTSPGFIRVSAEDPLAMAEVVQYDKTGKEISIKYLQSAWWNSNAERYLRNNGYLHADLEDFTFEVDDNWRPYYTVSNVEWTIGESGEKVKSVIILDLQTGDIKECPVEDIHTKYPWIDRAQSLEVIDEQCKMWGEYGQVDWKWTSSMDGLRKMPTEGWYLVYDMGKCYFFTGWTSTNKKTQDLIGMSITDAQTGKTFYYPCSGVTEVTADTVAKTLWANYPSYKSSEVVPYNIYGTMTYVIPMVNGSQFVGISLVSMLNKDVKAKGNTMEEALGNYRISKGAVNSAKETASSGALKKFQIKGTISDVGMPIIQNTTQTFPFTIKDVKKIFFANYNFANPKVPFIKVGTEVVITYSDTKETVITVESLDIPAIQITSENPNQASWVENQKIIKAETGRVSNIQTNKETLDNEDLGKVNSDSLKKFLQKQKR